jgi:hypothetical protein
LQLHAKRSYSDDSYLPVTKAQQPDMTEAVTPNRLKPCTAVALDSAFCNDQENRWVLV